MIELSVFELIGLLMADAALVAGIIQAWAALSSRCKN